MWLTVAIIATAFTTIASAFFGFNSIFQILLFLIVVISVAVFTLNLVALLIYDFVIDTMNELFLFKNQDDIQNEKTEVSDTMIIIFMET
ncbi:membrane protein A20A [Saimiriine betaherpesvirus 4]|uniref:Membrane protein A20A n=1 Tax=Saimiriine betaherpesvirus 4 TaxID=1535247 RepID=G8XSV4_9BETA|nr:membrane protein A20A [Saimiriine betaherpesvirus 4]AEV81009.1 membrane protein A20A [Saimiriine betaherpesvirus 4]